jgi:adenylate cyclase
VSPDVIKEIRNKPGLLQQRNVSREQVTILHLETRGYTVLYEELSAEELSEYLNIYLTKMTDVVFELGGTIDRYEGTALTAHWGSPIHYTDAPSRACRAALRMQSLIKELSPNLVSKGLPPQLPLFVITTADVMVGNFGSEQRANYSILGDYMDILRRLVTLNYNFQTNILITQFTYQYVENEFEVRLLAEKLQTKGKDQPIAVYELCGQIGKPTK